MTLKRILFFAAGALAAASLTIVANAADLPSRYDLREVEGALPEIRDQGEFGSCWAFATLANAETWLKKNGFGDYDFSERHMEGICSEYYDDFTNLETGILSRAFGVGGFTGVGLEYLFSGFGPVLEEDCPYIKTAYEANVIGCQHDYQLKTAGLMLKDADIFESVSDRVSVIYSYQDKISQLKQEIYATGAVPINYCSDNSGYCGTDGANYYGGNFEQPNHVVSLVGWDDDFPKENFMLSNGIGAEYDGAFIVRNSWSDDFGENGYFYMSYECPSLYRDDFTSITRMDYVDYDNLYRTGAYFHLDWKTIECDDTNVDYFYQVFDKSQNEQAITEVTLALRKSSSYEVYIVPDYNGTLDGKQLVSSGNIERSCFKTIEFDPVKLTGDSFAVMVKLSSEDADLSLLPTLNASKSMDYIEDPDSYNGHCFVSSDGENWTDSLEKLQGSTAFIRAYTVNTAKTHTLSFSSEYNTEVVSVFGANGNEMLRNPDGSFTLDDGTYAYIAKAYGFETIEDKVTISGNEKAVQLAFKKCPEIYTDGDYFGISDKDETFNLSFDYGYAGETLEEVEKVTVNGKEVGFKVEDAALMLTRADIKGIKTGDLLTIIAFYKNGTNAKIEITAKNNSCNYRLNIAIAAIINKLDKLKPSNEITTDYLDELIGEVIEKYSKRMTFYVTLNDFQYAKGSQTGFYDYSINIQYEDWYDIINYAKEFSAKESEPVLKNLTGWDAIISSSTVKRAVRDGSVIRIKLADDGIVPEEFWKKVIGSKATLELTTTSEQLWRVNCSDVKAAADMDFTLYSGLGIDTFKTYNYEGANLDIPFHISESITVPADLTINLSDSIDMSGQRIYYVDILKIEKHYTECYQNGAVLYRSGKLTITDLSAGSYSIFQEGNNTLLFGDFDNEASVPDENDYETLKKRIEDGYYDGIASGDRELVKADANEDGFIDKNDLAEFKIYLNKLEEENNG